MARPCKLCTNPDQPAVRAALISGATDRDIGRQFDISHVSVGRHRREHVVRPMQAAAAALDKGRGIRQRRERMVEQAAQGDPTAIFKLETIAADIARIAARLDGSAHQAAGAGQHTAHAALAGQLLRQAEFRARLGGHDKPAPAGSEGQSFSVNIIFGSTGETVSINTVPGTLPGAMIDADPAADP